MVGGEIGDKDEQSASSAENQIPIFRETGETWDRIRSIMERLHLGEFSSKDGRVFQRMEMTPEQANILNRLKIAVPLEVLDVRPRA